MVISLDVTMQQLQELVPDKKKRYFYTVVPTAPQYMSQAVFVGDREFESVIFHLSGGDVLVTDFVDVYKNPITQVGSIN